MACYRVNFLITYGPRLEGGGFKGIDLLIFKLATTGEEL